METRSPICRRPIEACIYRRLHRPWGWPGASVRSIAKGNRARSKRERLPRWNPFMGKETQFSRVKVVPVVEEISAPAVSEFKKISSGRSVCRIGLDLMNRPQDDVAPNQRRNHEEPHSTHYLGAIDCDVCAGARFVRSKRGCDAKGSGGSTRA